jgi:hypothetical protein
MNKWTLYVLSKNKERQKRMIIKNEHNYKKNEHIKMLVPQIRIIKAKILRSSQ